MFSNQTIILPTILSTIIIILSTIIVSSNTASAKICVATSLNRYLCTDDAAKARAHQWKDAAAEPVMKFDYESLDLGENQEIEGTLEEKEAVANVLSDMRDYFETEVLVKEEYDSVIGRCKNHNKLCAFWTSLGECDNNRGFMVENCAATCQMCLAILSK